MDNHTMPERGFVKSEMTDHEFAAFIRKNNSIHRSHLIGTVYTVANDETLAVVTYDNETCTRTIWIKEGKL